MTYWHISPSFTTVVYVYFNVSSVLQMNTMQCTVPIVTFENYDFIIALYAYFITKQKTYKGLYVCHELQFMVWIIELQWLEICKGNSAKEW